MCCTKSPMDDVVYGRMAMMSTGATTTAEPVGCGTVYIGSTYVVYK